MPVVWPTLTVTQSHFAPLVDHAIKEPKHFPLYYLRPERLQHERANKTIQQTRHPVGSSADFLEDEVNPFVPQIWDIKSVPPR